MDKEKKADRMEPGSGSFRFVVPFIT